MAEEFFESMNHEFLLCEIFWSIKIQNSNWQPIGQKNSKFKIYSKNSVQNGKMCKN